MEKNKKNLGKKEFEFSKSYEERKKKLLEYFFWEQKEGKVMKFARCQKVVLYYMNEK